MKLNLKTASDFRAIPKLRKRLLENETVAHSGVKARQADFLYYHGPGRLGIYYERSTVRQACAALRYYRGRCGPIVQIVDGDCDGLIVFEVSKRAHIPRTFFKQRVGNIAGLRKTQSWA